MSAKAINVLGKRFGVVLVAERYGSDKSGALWKCLCDCGVVFISHGHTLVSGRRKSCGCESKKRTTQMGQANKRHGMSGTTEYNIWLSMRARCSNPKSISYPAYGAKGISVCERWENSFDAFYEDMGARPSKRHSIDRIDGAKGYTPENCRWASLEEQARNKRTTHKIEWDGEQHTLTELIQKVGIPEQTVYGRIRAGASIMQALTMKKHQRVKTLKTPQALEWEGAEA